MRRAEAPSKDAITSLTAGQLAALASEWEGFAQRLRLNLDLIPSEERPAAEVRAQVWLAAAQEIRRALVWNGTPTVQEEPGRSEVLPNATD